MIGKKFIFISMPIWAIIMIMDIFPCTEWTILADDIGIEDGISKQMVSPISSTTSPSTPIEHSVFVPIQMWKMKAHTYKHIENE